MGPVRDLQHDSIDCIDRVRVHTTRYGYTFRENIRSVLPQVPATI